MRTSATARVQCDVVGQRSDAAYLDARHGLDLIPGDRGPAGDIQHAVRTPKLSSVSTKLLGVGLQLVLRAGSLSRGFSNRSMPGYWYWKLSSASGSSAGAFAACLLAHGGLFHGRRHQRVEVFFPPTGSLVMLIQPSSSGAERMAITFVGHHCTGTDGSSVVGRVGVRKMLSGPSASGFRRLLHRDAGRHHRGRSSGATVCTGSSGFAKNPPPPSRRRPAPPASRWRGARAEQGPARRCRRARR